MMSGSQHQICGQTIGGANIIWFDNNNRPWIVRFTIGSGTVSVLLVGRFGHFSNAGANQVNRQLLPPTSIQAGYGWTITAARIYPSPDGRKVAVVGLDFPGRGFAASVHEITLSGAPDPQTGSGAKANMALLYDHNACFVDYGTVIEEETPNTTGACGVAMTDRESGYECHITWSGVGNGSYYKRTRWRFRYIAFVIYDKAGQRHVISYEHGTVTILDWTSASAGQVQFDCVPGGTIDWSGSVSGSTSKHNSGEETVSILYDGAEMGKLSIGTDHQWQQTCQQTWDRSQPAQPEPTPCSLNSECYPWGHTPSAPDTVDNAVIQDVTTYTINGQSLTEAEKNPFLLDVFAFGWTNCVFGMYIEGLGGQYADTYWDAVISPGHPDNLTPQQISSASKFSYDWFDGKLAQTTNADVICFV